MAALVIFLCNNSTSAKDVGDIIHLRRTQAAHVRIHFRTESVFRAWSWADTRRVFSIAFQLTVRQPIPQIIYLKGF